MSFGTTTVGLLKNRRSGACDSLKQCEKGLSCEESTQRCMPLLIYLSMGLKMVFSPIQGLYSQSCYKITPTLLPHAIGCVCVTP